MCGCSRIALADRTPAILVVATEAAGPHLSLDEQARRLLVGCDEAVALFAADGSLLHATPAAQDRLGRIATLTALGAAPLGAVAMAAGRAEGDNSIGKISLRAHRHRTIDRLAGDAGAPARRSRRAGRAASTTAHRNRRATSRAAGTKAGCPAAACRWRRRCNRSQRTNWRRPRRRPSLAAAADAVAGHGRATPAAALRLADGCRRPLHHRFRRVHRADRAADRLRSRPTLERNRRGAGLDPEGQVARAFASRDTWSGITVAFPVDGSNMRLAVELSGLPVFDRDRSFRGYRGFGVCRDIARIAELMQTRRDRRARRAARGTAGVPRRAAAAFGGAAVGQCRAVPLVRADANGRRRLTPVERKAFQRAGEPAHRPAARPRQGRTAGRNRTPKRPRRATAEPSPPELPSGPLPADYAEPPRDQGRHASA